MNCLCCFVVYFLDGVSKYLSLLFFLQLVSIAVGIEEMEKVD